MSDARDEKGPVKIYLEPGNCTDERMWCEDDDPDGSGIPWTKYVRADRLAALEAEVERLRHALAPFARYACDPVGICEEEDLRAIIPCSNCVAARVAALEADNERLRGGYRIILGEWTDASTGDPMGPAAVVRAVSRIAARALAPEQTEDDR